MSKIHKDLRQLKSMKTAQLRIDGRSKVVKLRRQSNVQRYAKNAIFQEMGSKLR